MLRPWMALAVVCASTTVIAGEQVRPHRGSPARPSIEQSSEARIQQVGGSDHRGLVVDLTFD